MATWAEFEAAEPEMAALGPKPPEGMGFALGRLFAAIPTTSPKGNDLRRDGRYMIHALPFGHDDGEFSLRGRAREVDDDETRATVQAAVAQTGVGGMIESVRHDPLFEFDIARADVARWENVGQPGTYAVRRRWPG